MAELKFGDVLKPKPGGSETLRIIYLGHKVSGRPVAILLRYDRFRSSILDMPHLDVLLASDRWEKDEEWPS